MLNSSLFPPFSFRRPAAFLLIILMIMGMTLLTALPVHQQNLFAVPSSPNAHNPSLSGVQTQASAAPPSLFSAAEIVDRRDAYTRHYDLSNGRFLAATSLTPLNYKDASGHWQPIQPAFQAEEAGFTVRQNSLQSFFRHDATAVSLQSGDTLLVWRPQALVARSAGAAITLATPLPAAQTAPPALNEAENRLTYAQAWSLPGLTEQFHSGPGALKQELLLAAPPTAVPTADWLEFQALLAIPTGTQIIADGQVQPGEFTTAGSIELRAPDGALLLELAPPVAYELGRQDVRVNGRYHLIPQPLGFELRVQTPYAWWADPHRRYPAVFDPTMQVIQDLEGATISTREVFSGSGVPYPFASVFQSTCVGHFVTDPDFIRGYRRGYVRFPLPSLPPGTQPDTATLVAVPDAGWSTDPTYSFYNDRVTRQPTYVHKMTEDWSYLLTITNTTQGVYPAMEGSTNLATILKPDPGKGLTDLPATTWDVTGIVQDWYAAPATNYGFALKLEHEAFHFFEDLLLPSFTYPTFNCFPLSAQWSSLDDVVNNPSNPTTDGAGLGLLISYTALGLPSDEFQTIRVPSANPQGSYLYQYHEYGFPTPSSGWQIVAAQGAFTSTGFANVPLDLANANGDILISSDAGTASPGNENWDWQPNYIVVNGSQSPPAGLALRVQPDNQPTSTHNNKLHYLQTQTARPAPLLPGFGISTTVPITLFRELVRGQMLSFAEDTTVEIKVPYASAGLNPSTARRFDLQIFAPGFVYGSRTTNGAELTRGPDAYEIEFSIPPGQAGNWLLVLNSNQDRQIINMEAQVTVCQNNDDVVRYPLDGRCIELRRPPTPLPNPGPTYQELGQLRLLSPAGFSGNCNSVCTTNEEDNGIPVMPLIGFGTDNDHWVALKGGTLTLDRSSNRIYTSPDARLVLADFSSPTVIVSMPVLRGEFEALAGNGRLLTPISAPSSTYLLVKSPLHAQDITSGWAYEIELDNDTLHAFGPLVRQVRPTVGGSSTSFNFNADWRIAAQGGPTLQGAVALNTVSSSSINVGTLLLTPPNSGYSIEYNPQHASPLNPAALPLFLQLRMTGATIAQPDNLGGAKLPVQGVLLPPGQSVKDANGNNVALECGNHCLDLRGDPDAMTATGPLIDREYKMPDLIIQDTANTIMINTAGGVDIWSSDHPMSASNVGVNFNYEAYDGSVRTYRGQCPGPRDPLNPDQQAPPGPITTVVVGTAGMVLPNAGADSGDLSGGPRIQASFTLCEGSLREMMFVFDTGTQTAIPLGNSGMYLNFIGGTVSLTPQQPNSPAYTTVVLDMRFRGMTPQQASSNILSRGVVTIDSRGLFDVQVQTGVQVFSGVGAGVDGHFWVAWSPLDLGFEVEGCIPYNGFEPTNFPASLCDGDELLYGMLRMHMWQGQGWQNAYDWLPDDDALHVAARFEARLTIAAGLIVDWGPMVIPPGDVTLAGLKLAFGEFCTNNACTVYEWGVMGAFVLLGYDIGAYYGFDTGISFIMGSADYVLIDEAGLVMSSLPPQAVIQERGSLGTAQTSITIEPGQSSALFALAWQNGAAALTLTEPPPGNRVIDLNTVAPDVTVATTPTAVSQQTILVIDQPLPGAWQVDFGNPAPTTAHRFIFFTNQPAPGIVLSDLPLQAIDQPGMPISWTSSISGHGRISLYYEQIAGGLDPTQDAVGPIVERLPLTSSGIYTWNLQGMASGSYRVFARVDNETAVAVNDCGSGYQYNPDPTAPGCNTMLDSRLFMPIDQLYAPGSVRIQDNIPPAAPQGVSSRPEGVSSVVVRWQPNPEKDLAGYLVTCQQPGLTRVVRVVAQIQASQTLSETARVNGLDAVPAICSVEAYDSSGNVSAPSASTSSTPTGDVPLPPAAVQGLQLVPMGPGQIQVSWQPSVQAVSYLVYYTVLFNPDDDDQVFLNGPLAVIGGSLTGGFRALEGRSPLNVGEVTRATLSGLPPGATYEVWVRPVDADGRVGEASSAVRIVVSDVTLLYMPAIFRGQ